MSSSSESSANKALVVTAREEQVIELIARGMSNKEVAAELGIMPCTVRRHVEDIYARLGISKRTDLVVFAIEHGLAGKNIAASDSSKM